jgi:LysM repeat protein
MEPSDRSGVAAAVPGPSTDEAATPSIDAGQPARGCPFLIAASGDWRMDVPSREHRCGAFVPWTSLATEKQARLCLTGDHLRCATYVASVAARESRTGTPDPPERAGRWALARTTPLIADGGGARARLAGILSDRRRWPAIPALVLVVALVAIGLSGFRSEAPVAVLSSASPETTPLASPTATPSPTPAPSPVATATQTAEPTVAPTIAPSPTPAYRTIYVVVSGDTLSAIAAKFNTTVAAISTLNGITNPASLHVGQKLKIP